MDWIKVVFIITVIGSKDSDRTLVGLSEYFSIYYDYYPILSAILLNVYLIKKFYNLENFKISRKEFVLRKMLFYFGMIYLNMFLVIF